MATPVFYQTVNMLGVDPTIYYVNLATAGASITPEYPAPPFAPGMQAFGTDGSQFVFVQASTSISLTDFVAINIGQTNTPYQANSITTTNIQSTLIVGVGSTGLVLKQSVSFVPAGAFFWALTRGQFVPASTSSGLATNTTGGVMLFSATTAGILTSITVSSSLTVPIAGIVCINSLAVSIPASVVPAGLGGTQSNGFTVGPVVNVNLPRAGTQAAGLLPAGF